LSEDLAMSCMISLTVLSFGLGAAGVLAGDVPATRGAAADASEEAREDHRQRLREYALRREGNVQRGKELFFSVALGCVNCHTVDGSGGSVGPDLSAIAVVRGRVDLTTSVLEPSARFAPGFRSVTVRTGEGRVISGSLLAESEEELALLVDDEIAVAIAKSEIDEYLLATISDMPDGLVDQLSPQQFADLIAYLESLRGTVAPEAIALVAVWRVQLTRVD
jgi:putative heme-binding domain-containing protein